MPGGRPSKLTDEVQKHICEGIRLGMTYARAAAYVRIDYTTFRKWMINGEANKSKQYRKFFEAVKEAEADAVRTCLAIIRKAALDGQWAAAAWLLDRRYPGEYDPTNHRKEKPEKEPTASPDEAVNKIREVYGLPPKSEDGGNGHAKAKDDASGG
jgi:hypothetical protein